MRKCWKEWCPDSSKLRVYAVDAAMEKSEKTDDFPQVEATLAIVRFGMKPDPKRWSWSHMKSNHVYIGEAELEAIVWAVEDALAPKHDGTL